MIFQNVDQQTVNLFISNTTFILSVSDRLKYESKKSRSAGNSTGKYPAPVVGFVYGLVTTWIFKTSSRMHFQ